MVDIIVDSAVPLPDPDPIRFPVLLEDGDLRDYLRTFIQNLEEQFEKIRTDHDNLAEELGADGTLQFSKQLSVDPADPAAGKAVMWHSDGTGSGDDGDIMIKITDSGGTTKTGTIADFSTL